ncbi:MAG: 4Fe-4S binding protein [Spongiibacteraceae bacterium]
MSANDISADNASAHSPRPFFLWRHLNKLRWLCLIAVFSTLIFLPFISVYQNFLSAHAYDLLSPSEKTLYDVVEALTNPFVDRPVTDLNAIKGTTWSGTFYGVKVSDPLALLGQVSASLSIYWPFAFTVLIPVILSMIFGRFFCGWICPATLIYELNSNLGVLLEKLGLHRAHRRFDRRLKYGVLAVGMVLSALTGSVLMAMVYPPAIIGRELYYGIALGGFGSGAVFFICTLLFDLLVSRRGFCRYLCPGGALYSLLGRYRLLRIKREVERCNDCAKCNAVCEFDRNPMRDDFGQECNNCTACIAVCPTEAMTFIISPKDNPPQGLGHLGKKYRAAQRSSVLEEQG